MRPYTEEQPKFALQVDTMSPEEKQIFAMAYVRTRSIGRACQAVNPNARASRSDEFINDPEIKDYIRQVQKAMLAEESLETKHLVGSLAAQVKTEMRDIMDWSVETGAVIKPPDEIPDYAHHAIKKIKSRTDPFGRTEVEVELYDRAKANDQLMKHLGGYREDNLQKSVQFIVELGAGRKGKVLEGEVSKAEDGDE